MSAAAITFPRQSGGVRAYLNNVGFAARSLLAALLAVEASQSTETVEIRDPQISPQARAKSIWELYRMASQYDSVMPSLAAELRCIASRD